MLRANRWLFLASLAWLAALGLSCGAGGDDDASAGGRSGAGGSGHSGDSAAAGDVALGGAGGQSGCNVADRITIRWQQLKVGDGPGSRSLHAVATSEGGTVLFGGRRGGSALDDTWTFDAATAAFTAPKQSASPPARAGHAMSSTGSAVLLFGGSNDSGFLGDTWSWANDWTQLCDATSCEVAPQARSHHALAFDAGNKQVVLFGGTNGAPLGDTWTWNDGWQAVCEPSATAAGGAGGQPSDGAAGSAGNGSGCGPAPRADHALVFDAVAKRVVLFGGSNGVVDFDDVWTFNDGSWSRLEAQGPGPSSRAGHAMAFDDATGLVIVVGGTHDGLPVDDAVWALSVADGRWSSVEQVGRKPSVRAHAALFADGTGHLVLQGGGTERDLGDSWSAQVTRTLGSGVCDCLAECQDLCRFAGEQQCAALCASGATLTAEDCQATGSPGGSPGFGGSPSGEGVAGAAGQPALEPPQSSDCQALWECCGALDAKHAATCRSTASRDDVATCGNALQICQVLQGNPDQADDCLSLSQCCPSLGGGLKDDCVALLPGDAAGCREFYQGGFCKAP